MVHSRYVTSAFQADDMEALFSRLRDSMKKTPSEWEAIIVVHEGIVRRLIATGDEGGFGYLRAWQPGAWEGPAREFMLGKFGMAAVCERRHLIVPPSRVCHTVAELQEFGEGVGWPIMCKPPQGTGGYGLVKFDSSAGLNSNSHTMVFPILGQKYIRGRRGVVDMLCSLGRPLAWLTSYTTRSVPAQFGASTARQFQAMPALRPLVEEVARFTKFEGLCGFDWIEEEGSGRHYLIEFHPRPPSGFRFGRFCGVDFSAAIAAWLKSGEISPPKTQPEGSSIAAHYFPGDLYRCFRQRDWRGLKPWLPGSGACHDVCWDDPCLFAAWAIYRCRRFLQVLAGDTVRVMKSVVKSTSIRR